MKTDLLEIPNVGKRTKESLINIGITCAEDLIGQNPEELYVKDCLKKGFQVDRCQLYLFRMAVYYAEHTEWEAEKLKWWYWKDKQYPERNYILETEKLANLSLEELWELFPITFVDNNERFEKQYSAEKDNLKLLLSDYAKRISHIGSTAIRNIKTKPIVDVLIETDFADRDIVKDVLIKNGYILMRESFDKVSFNKGYTINGYADKVFHIHIKRYGDCDELYFRDYLNDNYEKAKEYEKLKEELYNKYKPNRDLYTDGKTEFISKIVIAAKEKYKEKY